MTKTRLLILFAAIMLCSLVLAGPASAGWTWDESAGVMIELTD